MQSSYFLYHKNDYPTNDINIVEIIFYRFDSSFVTLKMEKKDAGGQMKRRKSRVTDDRGRANLTSFSVEETPYFATLPSCEEVTALRDCR